MISRRDAAQRLDIPLEMATRHGLPKQLTETEVDALDQDPPEWLAQSRANRTGKRPVWVELVCDVCGYRESARPKKWWPSFDLLSCEVHGADELPPVRAGYRRGEYDGIGTRFVGIVDEKLPGEAPAEEAPGDGAPRHGGADDDGRHPEG